MTLTGTCLAAARQVILGERISLCAAAVWSASGALTRPARDKRRRGSSIGFHLCLKAFAFGFPLGIAFSEMSEHPYILLTCYSGIVRDGRAVPWAIVGFSHVWHHLSISRRFTTREGTPSSTVR